MLLVALSVSGCVLVDQLIKDPGRPTGMTSAAIRVQGAKALAGGIAMQELLRGERAEIEDAGALAPDGGAQAAGDYTAEDADFARCFLKPENYTVWVELGDAGTSWQVVISPSARCAQVYGAGGEWEIDAESFQILRGELYE